MMMKLKIKKLNENAVIPTFAHEDDAGMDLYAVENEVVKSGEWKKIPTGIAIQLEKGTEAQIRPRSGLAMKYGVTMLNTPGTIDSGYRGEICVLLINHGKNDFLIQAGDRIAQMVIASYIHPEVEIVETLEESVRGQGGFGSTGE